MNSLNPLQQRSFLKSVANHQSITSSRLAKPKVQTLQSNLKLRRRSNLQNFLIMPQACDSTTHSRTKFSSSFKKPLYQKSVRTRPLPHADLLNSDFLRSINKRKNLFKTEVAVSSLLNPKQFMKMTKKGPVKFRRVFSSRRSIF